MHIQSEGSKSLLSNFRISPETIKLLNEREITHLFPIQSLTYDSIYDGNDIIGRAMTGQGKTLAFILPVIEKIKTNPKILNHKNPCVIVVSPTRELARQTSDEFNYCAPNLRQICVYGGTGYDDQIRYLRNGIDILIGTPGRIIDHIERGTLHLEDLKYIILDEADRMLDMGFQPDIDKIFNAYYNKEESSNKNAQILLFSATIPDWVKDVAQKYMKKNYKLIDLVGDKQASSDVKHYILKSTRETQPSIISDLIKMYCRPTGRCIIFCDTKVSCDELSNSNELQHSNRVLHGDIPQKTRETTLEDFAQYKFKCLIATDVAARGLDIDNVDLVINREPPSTNFSGKADYDTYVHRSGRTGRAGKSGICITLYTNRSETVIQSLEKALGSNKFIRISSPQPKDILLYSASQILDDMKEVKENMVELLKEKAEECLKEFNDNPVEAIARCYALILGSKTVNERSVLSGMNGYVAYEFNTNIEMRTLSYCWGALKKMIDEEKCSKIKGMIMTEDSKGAVFDLPAEFVDEFDAKLKNFRNPAFVRCEKLPKLKQREQAVPYQMGKYGNSRSYSGGRGGGGRGGGGRAGGRGGGNRGGGRGGRR